MAYDRKAVGMEIRRRRRELGLTQAQAAQKIHRALRFYSRIELGDAGMSVDTLLEICRLLKTTPDVLLLGKTSDVLESDFQWIEESIANCSESQRQTAMDLLNVYLKSV